MDWDDFEMEMIDGGAEEIDRMKRSNDYNSI
jgi:hypothetical protein